jgi:hypothetical protein
MAILNNTSIVVVEDETLYDCHQYFLSSEWLFSLHYRIFNCGCHYSQHLKVIPDLAYDIILFPMFLRTTVFLIPAPGVWIL